MTPRDRARRKRSLEPLRAQLKTHGVWYNDIASAAGVSWSMVYKVLNGYRTSAHVISEATKLCS